MQIGAVLGEAWGLYKRFFGRFFLTAVVVFAVLDLLAAAAHSASGHGWVSGVLWGTVAAVVGAAIVSGLIQAAFSPLPHFLDSWLGSLVGDSITVPFVAAALTTAYFRLARRTEDASAQAPVTPTP